MQHIELTETERTEVLSYWTNYFRNAGQVDEPSAFQMDALNDKTVRDCLMWWQLGAVPDDPKDRFNNVLEVLPSLGNSPEPVQSLGALVELLKKLDANLSLDDVDTSAVPLLMNVMWQLISGDFAIAKLHTTGLTHI